MLGFILITTACIAAAGALGLLIWALAPDPIQE